jgi:hypothetical protein
MIVLIIDLLAINACKPILETERNQGALTIETCSPVWIWSGVFSCDQSKNIYSWHLVVTKNNSPEDSVVWITSLTTFIDHQTGLFSSGMAFRKLPSDSSDFGSVLKVFSPEKEEKRF